MIILEFAGQALALDDEEFEAARERGLKLMAAPRSQVEDEILDPLAGRLVTSRERVKLFRVGHAPLCRGRSRPGGRASATAVSR